MENNTTYTGSLRELLRLAVPLMLTWVSTTVMLLVDRLFLSHYSLEALGAAVNAGSIAWGFAYGFQIFAEMSQVVIAQYRGAGRLDRQVYPVWQMLWLVLFSAILYVPLALYGGLIFFAKGSLQLEYFSWFLFFGPAFGLIGASSAYFIGRGENRIVTLSATVGNAINIILDYLMIFGVKGVFAPMGVKGAAIATGIGMSVQGLMLFALFLKRTNYKVLPFSFAEFRSCFRVGAPSSAFMTAELIGWGLFFSMMAKAGYIHITVVSICHSLLPLLSCVGIGLQKAVSTITGNLIGAKRQERIAPLLFKALGVLCTHVAIVGFVLFVFPDLVIKLFQNKALSFEVVEILRVGFLLSVGYLFFGGLRTVISGVLSAAGDSLFLTVFGSFSIWILLLGPVYYLVVLGERSVLFAQTVLMLYGVVIASVYFIRYRFGNWQKDASLIEEKVQVQVENSNELAND